MFPYVKFTVLAYSIMAFLNSPDSSGVNLLNIGMIQIGPMIEITNDMTVTNIHAYSQDREPVYSKKQRMPIKKGAPIRTVRNMQTPFYMMYFDEMKSVLFIK